MKTDALAPYGRALRDYYTGDTDATVVIFDDFGERDAMPVSMLFREPSAFFPFEEAALDLCRGSVLDIGAGTGLFTRMLAGRVGPQGHVYAVDIAQNFVDHVEQSCQKEGLKNVEGVLCTATSCELPP